MAGKWFFGCILVLICGCLAAAGQPARPLFIKFGGCSKPPFFPQASILAYRQHLLANLMHVFRLRHPVDTIGGPQVMAACAQAAALLDAYRSVRSAYLGYHMQHDPHAGMSEDSAAWMAGRFNLMLQEDQAVANDKNVRKGLKWCIESGASHTRRITQYLLSRCRDESKETSAQVYAWAALSVGVAETFFRGQLACTINAQESSEIDLGLVKAALSISWGRMEAEEVLEPHALLVQAVSSISKSKLLTDSDKKRVEKNCSMIGKPQMQPFWPFDKDPQHLDEALLSMYSVPSSGDSEAGHGEEGSGNQEPPPEPHAHSGSSVHPDDPRGPVNEGADPSGEQPYPRGQPPPPPPPTHRGKPPLEAMEEERPHQSTAVVSQENHEEQALQHETDEAPVPTQEEQAQPQEAEEGPPVPPPHEENQPSAEDHNKEEVEDKPPSGLIAPVILANHDDHELPKPKPPSPPPGHDNPPDAPSKEPELEPNEKLSDQSGAHSSPVPIVQEHSDGNIDETQRQRKLPERISIGSAGSRFPVKPGNDRKPGLKRSPSDEYKAHREIKPTSKGSQLYSHRLLAGTASDPVAEGGSPSLPGSPRRRAST